jgi:hypothetical protein
MSKDKKATTITLTIATSEITPSSVSNSAHFSDNWNEKEKGNDPKNYKSEVYKDKDIYWEAVLEEEKSNPQDAVQIVVVFKKPGTTEVNDILAKDSYYAINGVVQGKAKKNANDSANEEYLVVFSVTLASTQVTSFYLIDPTLRVRPQ